METDEVRGRPLDSFGGRLPCYLNCIGRLFSYWQGRFAACALLTFPLEWSPAERLGRCPKPHKGRRPLTLQGTLSLDPFWAARLGYTSKLSGVWCFRVSFSASFESAPPGAFPP